MRPLLLFFVAISAAEFGEKAGAADESTDVDSFGAEHPESQPENDGGVDVDFDNVDAPERHDDAFGRDESEHEFTIPEKSHDIEEQYPIDNDDVLPCAEGTSRTRWPKRVRHDNDNWEDDYGSQSTVERHRGGISIGFLKGLQSAPECKQHYTKGYKAGYERGIERGHHLGLVDGEKSCHDDGFIEGEKSGFDKGFTAGEKKGVDVGEKLGFKRGRAIGRAEGEKAAFGAGRVKGLIDGVKKGNSTGFLRGKAHGYKLGLNKCPRTVAVPPRPLKDNDHHKPTSKESGREENNDKKSSEEDKRIHEKDKRIREEDNSTHEDNENKNRKKKCKAKNGEAWQREATKEQRVRGRRGRKYNV